MKSTNARLSWIADTTKQTKIIGEILNTLGFKLDENQLHISGERYLMTRNKLVLSATKIDGNKRVIVKASEHADGKKEIATEKTFRDSLLSIEFTKKRVLFPKEIYYGKEKVYDLLITEYISQDKIFVDHAIKDQFFIILHSFEAQEAFHATTFEHIRKIEKVFPIFTPQKYIESFTELIRNPRDVLSKIGEENKTLELALDILSKQKNILERYSGYLTHTDFVPHNFRIHNRTLYMLDCSAVHFGNKYEGWARFLNYMLIHNPELEQMLDKYIDANRGKDEYLDLQLMRIYKIGYLINYYANSLDKTEGELYELTKIRLIFWNNILTEIVKGKKPNQEMVDEYRNRRNILRSPEEKRRQQEFAQV